MTTTINGRSCDSAEIQIPEAGVWWATVRLAEVAESELAKGSSCVLQVDAVPCTGVVVAGGIADGRESYRIAGGRGRWGATIPRRAYQNDAGVAVASVYTDAALEAGEVFDPTGATARLGPHYVRAEGLASASLNTYAPRAWHVGLDGVTRLGVRSPSQYTGDGVVTRLDPEGRVISIATDDITGLVPGVSVNGSEPAIDVEIRVDADKPTVVLYTGTLGLGSRRLRAYAKLFDALDPARRYRGVWEYRVVTQSGERLNLQPVRISSGMPDLANVPVRPGMAGLRADVMLGERVLVCFADCDPSRPQVFGHEEPGSPGWMPLTLELGGPGALGAARVTDPVIAGPFAGAITMGSIRVKVAM